MKKYKFEFNSIKSAKTTVKPIEIRDTGENKGLSVWISKAGSKTYYYRYRFAGRNKRFIIGRFPDLSVTQARNKASTLRTQIIEGIDPQAEKDAKKWRPDNMTVGDLAQVFIAEYLPKKKKSTQADYKSRINSIIVPTFGKIPIKDVDRGHVKRFLKKMAEDKPIHANRVQAIFSKMFSYGVQEEYTTHHPLKKLEKYGKEVQRERFYSSEEIRALWDGFSQQPEPLQTLLKMLMICGGRLGETSRMKWGDIDTDNALWIIPKEETKAGRTHIVPLPEMAAKTLENIHPLTGHGTYVFQSPLKENQPLVHFLEATKRLRKLSKIEDFRIHDMRRIVATNMINLDIDFTIIGKVLNHSGLAKESIVTSRYINYDYLDKKKEALNRWSFHLQQIIEGKKEANIYKIG